MAQVRAAMILAAGLGTRLRPLTNETPKPLVPVGDAPALALALAQVRKARPECIVANVFHHADAAAGAFRALDPELVLSVEEELLGTAGGVARAEGLLGAGAVLVWNADILADVDVPALVAAHTQGVCRDATLVVTPARAGLRGNVGLDAQGRVVRLREVATGPEERSAFFAGIHVLGADLRAALPERGCLVGDVYIPALRAGARLASVELAGGFVDIGNLESYLAAQWWWLEARGLPRWCARSSEVDPGVGLGRVVLGAGARVSGEGILDDVVVWPGATVRAPLASAIVTPRAVVPVPRSGRG